MNKPASHSLVRADPPGHKRHAIFVNKHPPAFERLKRALEERGFTTSHRLPEQRKEVFEDLDRLIDGGASIAVISSNNYALHSHGDHGPGYGEEMMIEIKSKPKYGEVSCSIWGCREIVATRKLQELGIHSVQHHEGGRKTEVGELLPMIVRDLHLDQRALSAARGIAREDEVSDGRHIGQKHREH